MSAIVLLPVILPAAGAAWPLVAAAATAAAAGLGFGLSRRGSGAQEADATAGETDNAAVEISLAQAETVTATLAHGQELVFTRDDLTVTFSRNARGQTALRVHGKGRSEADLRALGESFANRIVQQYAYHRLVTELQKRNGTIVEQQVDEDGTVRLQVRIFQG